MITDPQRVLIIHQNIPGQFVHIARHLAQRKDMELLTIGGPGCPGLPGVRTLRYRLARPPVDQQHPYVRTMESAVLRGQAVARILQKIKAQGRAPDVILAHPGWGETLYAKDILPNTRLVHYCEWYYGEGADAGFDPEFPPSLDSQLRARTWNALHTLNLEMCDAAISPTQWQKSRYPAVYQPKIQVIHEGIDTDLMAPDPQASAALPDGTLLFAGQPIVTYVTRNLEPYRGFHIFMRALEKLQQRHKTCRAVIVGGDDVSCGNWPKDAKNWREKMLREVKLDPQRTHFTGRLPFADFRRVLQVSAVHVYLTYPFVLSWSMLEARLTGCLLVASDTEPVRKFLRHEENGVLVDFFDVEGVAQGMREALPVSAVEGSMLRIASRQSVVAGASLAQGLIGNRRVLGASAANDKARHSTRRGAAHDVAESKINSQAVVAETMPRGGNPAMNQAPKTSEAGSAPNGMTADQGAIQCLR